jgi:DNA repair photolyase
MPAILEAAAKAGATKAAYVVLRLPYAVKDLFEVWLAQHFPDRAGKVMNRLLAIHQGKHYDGRFGVRQRGKGPFADQLRDLFDVTCRRLEINLPDSPRLSVEAFRRPELDGQGDLFG